MKIILRKETNIISCLDAISDYFVKEKDGMFARTASGSLYVTLLDSEGNRVEDTDEYMIDADFKIVPVKTKEKEADMANREALRRTLTARIAGDLIKAERQLVRDRKAMTHADNMTQSAVKYKRREETIRSWFMESDAAKKAFMRSNSLVRDLRAMLKALRDTNTKTDLTLHYATFEQGFYAGKEGVIALLDLGDDNGLVYCYKGLLRVSLKNFDIADYRGFLILAGRSDKPGAQT